MKMQVVGYWVTTGLVALAFAFGGVMDVMKGKDVIDGITHLGYPIYFATIIGVWKILAVPALLAPGLPRLKEWAYAGIVFDLTGAAASHAASGDPAANIITPLVLMVLALASWWLRPAGRKLAGPVL